MSEHPTEPSASVPGTGPTAAGTADWELFLLRLRYRESRLVPCAGNQPVLLDDPNALWVVYSGRVEVFAVAAASGVPTGRRRHLFSAAAGQALFGLDLRERQTGLLVSGSPGTQLLRTTWSNLARLAATGEFAPLVATMLDSWIEALVSALDQRLPPRELGLLETGRELELPARLAVRGPGQVVWIAQRSGSVRLLGRSGWQNGSADALWPLAPRAWLVTLEPTQLFAQDTPTVIRDPSVWDQLRRFHTRVQDELEADSRQRERAELARQEQRSHGDRARLDAAVRHLARAVTPGRANSTVEAQPDSGLSAVEPLLVACQLVGAASGIIVRRPPSLNRSAGQDSSLQALARASRLRTRQIALRGDWWNRDGGPFVGYIEVSGQPVALLPNRGGYELHDPISGTATRVDSAVATTLRPLGESFYRTFEPRSLGGRDLLLFGLRGCGPDVARIALVGLAIGLLATLTPIATGLLFDLVFPAAEWTLLLQLGAGLAIAACVSALFEIVREIAVLRLSGRLQATLEPAIMDRLLELPTSFFREYAAGDLGGRVLAVNAIRETLTGPVLAALFAALFSVFSFAFIFVYDPRLGLVATTLVVALLLVFGRSSAQLVRYQRELSQLGGRLSGLVLQLLNGVPKLRVAGAEERAFARWATTFAEQRRAAFLARSVTNATTTFTSMFPLLASAAFFGVAALLLDPRPTLGAFLAFNVAFSQFTIATLALVQAGATIVQVLPIYERAAPIFRALPEVDLERVDPGELHGMIDVDQVSFRYAAEGPLILDNVSLHCRPGEFIAIVGPSGSGKSTLLRLLLGFEAASAGAILYDGRDLASVDVRAVRRQIGSVLQDGRLMPGDVFSNIVGTAELTEDDAWEAAQLAGLEADLRELPMGLHTIIGEGGGTFSGGQRQRLLIARAIVHRPRLLFFDEATSALDNRTQDLISKSLESLAATRVVIAHRLSTIVNADRIYVLQQGRVVETGTYRELMQRRGVFADLARRQIA